MSAAAGSPMPTRILVVGSGGREHALAWKLSAEPGVNEVVVAPGQRRDDRAAARAPASPACDPLDGAAVVAAARSASVELVVIGPEAPLAAGVADALRAAGIPVFGRECRGRPDREQQGLLSRDRRGGRASRWRAAAAFDDAAAAIDFARGLDAEGRGVVVKADGLAAGKGVTVCDRSRARRSRPIDRAIAGGRRW